MDSILEMLPGPGLLPKWLLIVSTIAVANSLQAYLTTTLTKRVYSVGASSNQVTPLSSRTFGTWTLMSAVVRGYAAYNISNPAIYDMCLISYFIAWGHFMSEWLVFGTARWGEGLVGPAVVSTGSIVWMVVERAGYLGAAAA